MDRSVTNGRKENILITQVLARVEKLRFQAEILYK